MQREEPTWVKALGLLERGDREGAIGLLSTSGSSGSVGGDVLRRLLGVASGAEDQSLQEDQPPQVDPAPDHSSEWEPVADALVALNRGRVAITEGRPADAAASADQATEALARSAPRRWLWVEIWLAAVHQAVYRFSADARSRAAGIEAAKRVADRLERPHMAMLARSTLATIHLVSGRLHATLEATDSALALAKATGLADHRLAAQAHQFRAYALFEWNRLDEAHEALTTAWRLARGGSGVTQSKGVTSGVARVLASVAAARGDTDGADRWLAELEQIVAEPMTLRNREWLAAVRMRHGTPRDRDLRAIDAWQQRFDYSDDALARAPRSTLVSRLHEFEHLLTVLEVVSAWDSTLKVADAMLEGAGKERRWYRVRAHASRAVALEGLGRRDDADDAWLAALEAGDAEGYVRAYLDGGPLRSRIMRRVQAAHTEVAAVSRVAAAFEVAFDAASGGVEHLTTKQIEVVERLAEGLSNRDIARALDVSESTVRTHLRAVYARLGVGSRTQAVAAARKLGIVR